LNGITVEELQKMVKVSPGPNGNVLFDRRLSGRWPGQPAVPRAAHPRSTRPAIYLDGPGLFDFDLGLAK
jgi:hypothetical protein